jgi:serine/threonine protein kinase
MATGFRPGSLLGGRYRLERMLGTGGMATVWLARDERLGRRVAVKIISDTLAADPDYLRRFRREARLAAGLSHPNLVMLYDFGGEDDRPFLAMECVEGGTLADRISAGTARALGASRLARELLAALDHIHSAGILHRDVKPANVLVAADGTVKLTDFGIAQPEDATRLTTAGLVVGTRSYIAPEVGRGEPATRRSDLYSCGIVLREAIGDPPPPELADLLGRLGDEDPGRRPESASRALTLLAGTSTASGPEAGTATAPTQPLLPGRRLPPPRRLAAVALVAAIVVLGVILLAVGDDGSSTGARPALDSPADKTPPAEEPGAREEPAAPSEPPQGSGKPKKKDAPKKQPGTGKGRGKD